MDKLKILHFDEGFWLYYHRLEANCFKCPAATDEALKVNIDELHWLLKGYEVRIKSKIEPINKAITIEIHHHPPLERLYFQGRLWYS